jgi:hypothetical protein
MEDTELNGAKASMSDGPADQSARRTASNELPSTWRLGGAMQISAALFFPVSSTRSNHTSRHQL